MFHAALDDFHSAVVKIIETSTITAGTSSGTPAHGPAI